MKYSIAVLAFAAGVLALPQESASITSAPTSAASPSLTPQVSCIQECDAGDVTCQAACMGNARPNASQVVETTECAANCDQGSGSKEDTEKYAKCQQDCYASLFPSSQTNFQGAVGGVSSAASAAASGVSSAVASATNAAGSAAASVASSARSGAESATSSGSASGSETGSGAQSTESPGAASSNSVKIAGAGLAGLMAIFAL
ncbi:uncharacterized protein N0V89_011619 [Didymosphaeria variabile]|uniref:Uncharacterized protein n=1 Tax=Didymosphaeria variabile TaxID=1932322 RepID=A0A9W8XA29_9PLEO|nr:uncharacterized protein N0V89_011619 [Didymosphaeria variabile]KAJ4345487.1 hypothetical protein N0V89_011619 [Didymosphaeria variabile]